MPFVPRCPPRPMSSNGVGRMSGRSAASYSPSLAIGNGPDGPPYVTFKTSEMSFDLLKDQPGCRPAPYLASRGMKWIQRVSPESMDDAASRIILRESHRLVAAGLTRKARAELGLST